jgi:hypothetical protein
MGGIAFLAILRREATPQTPKIKKKVPWIGPRYRQFYATSLSREKPPYSAGPGKSPL